MAEEKTPHILDTEIHLEDNTCPNREERANGINSYYGNASDLVKDARAGNLKQCDRKFSQTSGCTLNFYLSVRVNTIRESAVIYHAPVGCSCPSLGYRELFQHLPVSLGMPENYDLHWITTSLNESDVVYGASEKLKTAIRTAQERYNPKAIFILTSCASGIIGEDVEGTVAEIQPEINARIVPIHCEGIRSRLVQTGYDAFWHAVLKYLVKPPQKKQKDLVNVASMLSYTWQDRREIIRLLGRMGLRVNFIPEFATIDQFEQLSEAAVTAPVCPTYTDYLSRGLEQEYGVPFFQYPSPMGFANTDGWLREIAKYTGKEKEAEEVIAEEHAKWDSKLAAIREEFLNIKGNGQKVELLGALGQGRLLAQMPYFDELGVKNSAAMCQDYDNLILEELEKMLVTTGDFKILVNTFQAAEQAHINRTLDPDMTLTCPFQGSSYKRKKGVTRVHSLRGDPNLWAQQSAYAGAVAYGNFLLQAFKTNTLQKTMLENTDDSYKPWFYEQPNPQYYQDTAE
ncbi:MAG TPA: nitrogenase component 1 [Methanospirillum sp.]|uniref:nitrogenase component 1 n=1 Tax=Methanospirillum sp. TaxID=45200 RepID=UPI002BFB1277|nr:nitrogenase component 1 [Methanospirillum sp.]HWQ64853.1 nitrogenase component 1 [Methanospirillum sp.]